MVQSHLQLFALLTSTVSLVLHRLARPSTQILLFQREQSCMEQWNKKLKQKTNQKKRKKKEKNLQCKIGFREALQFFRLMLLFKLVSGQSAKFYD